MHARAQHSRASVWARVCVCHRPAHAGFYNKKFFILFLVYTNLTLTFAVVFLASQAANMWEWLQSDATAARFFPANMVNLVIFVAAMAVDGLMLCTLVPFMAFHFGMAMRNETTIEGSTNSHFNVSPLANLRTVFGRRTWTWCARPLHLLRNYAVTHMHMP